jgi:HEPN domain-containing protein
MADRSKDRLAQAHDDLEQAEASRRDGRHNWACFAAQQAAEKALNALHLSIG